MFSIKRSGLDEAFAALDRLAGDLPKRALADALNHTANQARIALRAEMESVFDRPTPFTLNAVRILNAKPSSLEAAVWVKDEKDNNSKGQAPEDWVAPEVFGGPRVDKKSEMLLRRRGTLPAGRFIVPAEGARLDAYGNMSRGHMLQILSGLRLLSRPGYTADASNRWRSFRKGHAEAFFVMRRGKVPIGIAERRGKTVKMVLAFVRQPIYRQRLDFHGVVRRLADERLEVNVDKAVTDALTDQLPTRFERRS
ncbi:hypothetical protein [Azotobacter beijerinckii]|uniref:Uncharacterized protein n=1 Tax=Azotobacter beijerinckii TaxID=170623 RepID=A0A1I3ZN94_9GAMM|nr:hypothetical protein [Azotobacter beijerinckii]SFK45518.1 hypothetical protein SAMN04244574_00676 [Azotobacter beijerinckii]